MALPKHALPTSSTYFLLVMVISTVASLGIPARIVLQLAVVYDTNTAGGQRFDAFIGEDGALSEMRNATLFIFTILYNNGSMLPLHNVSNVTLFLDNQPETKRGRCVVFTRKSEDAIFEIHLSEKYVASYEGDIAREIGGIIYAQMTEVWEFQGRLGLSAKVADGIADYVRLKSKPPAAGWGKPGNGNRWDQGSYVTAYFFQYCEQLHPGFVAALNNKTMSGWNVDYFDQILGKSVEQLWQEYKLNSHYT